jgi:eukaryotic-like serine/threonine-protein kinase
MQPRQVVMDRFEIERVAGSGGMGTVYRAIDLTTREPVALKVLRPGTSDGAERFAREVRVLASLRHPGIVRYVADGATPGGEMCLAMEWLEGESLSQRLQRAALTTAQSIGLARRIAEALGVAHERGIVHRDVKPSNLFLPDGDLDRVKVLDFGVARITDATRASSTRTGMLIGTPGYMAPEQVRGDKDVGPRADVFAVGCLLFECLTGRAAFVSEHLMAVLAKILLEDAPRVRDLRPDLPPELDALVARILAKHARDRPRDGAQLSEELGALGAVETGEQPAAGLLAVIGGAVRPPGPPALTASERRLLCVILIGAPSDDSTPTLVTGLPAALAEGVSPPTTVTTQLAADALPRLRQVAELHGAHLEQLQDGAFVATVSAVRGSTPSIGSAPGGAVGARDQVAHAARCALALHRVVPTAPIALATGRGVLAGAMPVGEAIDRAAALLAAPDVVRIDDVTAGLLDTQFEIGGDAVGLYLMHERDVVEVSRTLMGQQTPCVGRERELAVLSGLFEECVSEPLARAVLVTAAEGVGKSRVRYELLRRIRDRGEPVEIWIGRGDPLRAGSPFGMIAPALRRTAGILDGEPLDVSRHKLRARVARNASTDLARTTLFLGELIGAPFPDDASQELRAARRDPLLMADQMHRAFEHLLAVETAAQPVVIVLEDLHWGDLPTTQLIDSALRALPDRPWLVLALARPDVHELFPGLWSERGVHEVRLDNLTKKGSAQLVKRVLGEAASDTLVQRLVEQAGGNAFYLEELIRAAADGKREALPETVLALVQGRLERLEVDARRVLRAASVFGSVFWRGGVSELLGGAARASGTRAWLDELVARELIARAPTSKFADDSEYLFRHALVREAAYAMLTDADRTLGHQLAATWLVRMGETDAITLAEHCERGGEPERAVEHYRAAAEQALAACDFAGAGARADRGVACGAQGETLGALRLVQAEAHKWAGDFVATARRGLEAVALLPRGSARWFMAAGEAAEASGKLDDTPQLIALAELLRDAPADRDALPARVSATAIAAFGLFQHGNYDPGQVLLDLVEAAATPDADPIVLARMHQTRSSRAMFSGDAGAYLESERAAAAEFERAGDLRYACMQRGHVGYAYLEIGAYAEAEAALREAIAAGTRLGLENVVATAKHNLGRALQHQHRLDEALAVETEAFDAFHAHNDRRLECGARMYLSYILLELGDLARAETELRAAIETATPPFRPQALASLARVLLAGDRRGEALGVATEAQATLDSLGSVEEGESLVRLMIAETLLATGQEDAARAAARRARERLLERAARISDLEWRRSFVDNIPENARTLELAAQLRAER